MSARRRTPAIPELCGMTEIARAYGVLPQQITKWASREDFPAPAVELAAGRIWTVAEVREHMSARYGRDPVAPFEV